MNKTVARPWGVLSILSLVLAPLLSLVWMTATSGVAETVLCYAALALCLMFSLSMARYVTLLERREPGVSSPSHSAHTA